jgi:hypothetical protein
MNNLTTRTKTYLLPNFVISNKIINRKSIKTAYLGVKGVKQTFIKSIYLLVDDPSLFEGYEQKLVYDKDVLLEYEYTNSKLHDNFINGRFSEFTNREKSEIISFYGLDDDHRVVQILKKSPELKKQMEGELKVSLKNYELGEKLNYEKECYDIDLSRD